MKIAIRGKDVIMLIEKNESGRIICFDRYSKKRIEVKFFELCYYDNHQYYRLNENNLGQKRIVLAGTQMDKSDYNRGAFYIVDSQNSPHIIPLDASENHTVMFNVVGENIQDHKEWAIMLRVKAKLNYYPIYCCYTRGDEDFVRVTLFDILESRSRDDFSDNGFHQGGEIECLD